MQISTFQFIALSMPIFVKLKTGLFYRPTLAFTLSPFILFVRHRLYAEGCELPLAGEIGFSVGRVYTSLSGWTEDRTAEGTGTAQLVLLGRWLEHRGYAFWSLGHCYSPEMEYKRRLGHRIFPRSDFRALLAQHRGQFRTEKGSSNFVSLQPGDTVAAADLLSMCPAAAALPHTPSGNPHPPLKQI